MVLSNITKFIIRKFTVSTFPFNNRHLQFMENFVQFLPIFYLVIKQRV